MVQSPKSRVLQTLAIPNFRLYAVSVSKSNQAPFFPVNYLALGKQFNAKKKDNTKQLFQKKNIF